MGILKKFATKKVEDSSIAEIILQLSNLLNTRKGFGALPRPMGIGDYNMYRARNKIAETIRQEIQENIEKYAPQVKLVDIQQVESDVAFRLRFELKCVLTDHSEKPLYIVFDSTSSKITVDY